MFSIVACIGKNRELGKKGELVFHIKDDMKFFRETTTGKVVVMGRKTLESFPNSKPLPNRVNIVLTRDAKYEAKGAVVVHSKEELNEELKKYNSDDIYVIGGESIYRLMLDECDRAFVTYVDYAYDADTYFPNLDEMNDWKLAEESEEQTYYDIEFYFRTYTR